MTLRYAVGIKIGNRADQMTVEAEDALIAAGEASLPCDADCHDVRGQPP
jgi:hypothetical protein